MLSRSARQRGQLSSPVLGAAILLAAFVLLRLPTLFEPAYSLDAGLYADIGRSLDHGAVLYRDVWDFKPPGLYFLAAALSLGHASVFKMQLALSGAVALGALFTWLIARRLAGGRAAVVAALLFMLLASVPSLAGDQLNAEVVAAVPSAAAMLIMIWRANDARRWMPLAAGCLAAFACLIKTQALADLLAIVAVPLITTIAHGRRPGVTELRTIAAVIAGWLVTLAVVCVPLALGGSLTGLVDTLTGPAAAYARHYQGGVVSGATPTLGWLVALARVSAALAVGAGAALVLARRGFRAGALSAWWLACVLAAIMVDTRGLSHYVQQADAPLSLVGALLFARLTAGSGLRRVAGAATALAVVWLTTVLAIYVPVLTGSVISGEGVPKLQPLGVGSDVRYYELGWRHVLGLVSAQRYDASFNNISYPLNESVAALLDAHSAPTDRVYVWGGSPPWTLALADRSSSSEFLWMNSGYAVYPDAESLTVRELRQHPPAILVAESALPASLLDLLHADGYKLTSAWRPSVDYWLAPWAIP